MRRALPLALVACALAPPAALAAAGEIVDLRPEAILYGSLYEGDFRAPVGVFCDHASGEIYVADATTNVISIFDSKGFPLFAFSDDRLSEPSKLAADREGRIYVLDNAWKAVKVYSYRGEFLGDLALEGLGPTPAFTAVTVDPGGTLYLGDSGNGEVLVVDAQRKIRYRLRGGLGATEFKSITGIAADGKAVYVSDREGMAIQAFDRVGRFLRAWGVHEVGKQNVSLPMGVAIDGKGRVALVDMLRQEIKLFEATGELIDLFGGVGRRPGEVLFPSDVSADAAGRLCVADRGNSRVQVLSPVEAGAEAAPPEPPR